MNQPINTSTLSAIEKAKLRLLSIKKIEAASKASAEAAVTSHQTMHIPDLASKGWSYDTSLVWNAEQMQAMNAAMAGMSFCLIGPAGSGKTSTLKGIVYSLIKNNLVPTIRAGASTDNLPAGSPGIILTSFTNMAVQQTAKHFSGDITCLTLHKVLEFAPVYYEAYDDKGMLVNKMKFEPQRCRTNPLPRELKVIIVDESSMVDCDLFQLLLDALPDPAAVQFIFLGDLNQLPPVYGGPILGRKLLELRIVELTQIYRQALLSPIIRYALDMKDGKGTLVNEKVDVNNGEHGRVVIHPWAGNLGWEDALLKAQNFCKGAIKAGEYDYMQDMILCPYNVNFGVQELNRAIADYLGRTRAATVWHVIAGFNEHYLAIGDKVLVRKQEAIITKIVRNGNYAGKHPLDPTKWEIDRYGGAKKRKLEEVTDVTPKIDSSNFDAADFDVDAFLDNMQADSGAITERKAQCSHRITVAFLNSHNKNDFDIDAPDHITAELVTAAEVNEMLFAYAITVHKSQGSEWRRVFFLTHKSHSKMCSRELMYTGMTRAKEYLYMIVEPDRVASAGTLRKAALMPRLKGNTLAEKLVSLKERFDREAKEKANSNQESED